MTNAQKITPRSIAGTVAEILVWIITALLPIKFATIVGVPEMPASYWFDPISLLFVVWPTHLLSFLSAMLLLLAALAHGPQPFRNRHAFRWIVLWILLAVLSFAGMVHASCLEYVFQMISYTFGTGAFAASLFLLLDRRPEFAKALFAALMCGAALSVISGLYQYFHGFDELQKYLAEQQKKLGEKAYDERFLSRVYERRLQGDFPSCNTYGGYLVMLLPVLFYGLWKFGATRVQPEKWSRWILSLPVIPIFFFLIAMTRSRGALLSFCLAIAVLCFTLPIARKIKWSLLAVFILCFAGFLVIAIIGRGFGSMIFRFDYDWAAIRMMFLNPLFGTGWGDFFHDYQCMKLLINDEAPHTPHNMFLLFGSQCGIPAFLASCAILFYPLIHVIFRIRKNEMSRENYLLPVLLFSISAAFVDFMLEVTYEDGAFLCSYIVMVMIIFYSSNSRMELPVSDEKAVKETQIFRIAVLIFGVSAGIFASLMMRGERAFAEFQELLDPRSARSTMQNESYSIPPPDAVMKSLKRATECDPYNPFPWATAAGYMAAIGELANAEELICEAIKRSPQRSSFYLRRAKIRNLKKDDPAKIKEDIDKARELFPMNGDYRLSDEDALNYESGH